MWMIAQAAWAETRHRVGSEMVTVPRGSFMATLREMQSAFMWGSDKRVRTFLKTLEKEGMIGRTTLGAKNAPKTQVTISNYEEYQSRGRTKDAPKTQGRTHHGRTTDAVKNKGTREQSVAKATVEANSIDILSSVVPRELASDFAIHRKDLKKPLTEKAAAAMVSKLEGHHDPSAVLTDSIANGWQGIFPEKIKPQLKAINGGQNGRREFDDNHREYARLIGSGQIQRGPDESDPFAGR